MKQNDATLDHDYTEAVAAYLQRVDMQLARAGLDRADRDTICHQIVEQFHDILPVPAREATSTQIEQALSSLSSDAAFAKLDITSAGQVLRMIWHRFWIGTPTPLALNDHGQKRILWSELLKRLAWMYVMVVFISLICNYMLMGKAMVSWSPFLFVFSAGLPLMIAIKIQRMPVESLPHVEHWPVNRMGKNRFGFSIIMIGACLIVAALFPGVYCLAALLTYKSIWPIDQELFLGVMMIITFLGMSVSCIEAWSRRQRRLQFRHWASGAIG